MTTPLSKEQRAELVAKAKAATPGPWVHKTGAIGGGYHIQTEPGGHVAAVSDWGGKPANAAFIAAANPEAILAYEATVVALTEERDAALERVKALEAGLVQICDQPDTHPSIGGRWIDWAKARARALLTPKDPGHG